MMLKSERKRGEIGDILIRAKSCAVARGARSPRARVPYNAGSEDSPPPVLRASAQTKYRIRYPAAYGCHRSPTPHSSGMATSIELEAIMQRRGKT